MKRRPALPRLTTLACCLLASPALATLSPFYDSAEQIDTILGDRRIAEAAHQTPIGAISNTGTRADGAIEWTIRLQSCDLKAYLLPVPPEGLGKTTYKVDAVTSCD
ncbi:hypothetical protein [Pseudodonghicola xiamenensis]|uniref:Uncharacterized protein n=1 Tax=Pseudodonghicola xiamenensis TaxID=337702 RepID=A0A8J3H8P8_9RHOB|nr:hypothetical protein [Pseudodonghicola xiamenensis]GHH00965.1 hypothetical protein GCM10010961_37930 [Pseudodonghicola xiamenensis]